MPITPFGTRDLVPSDPKDLARYLQNLAQELKEELTNLRETLNKVHHVAPAKPREGMLRFADGTDWNPGGTGSGFYQYKGGAWVKL